MTIFEDHFSHAPDAYAAYRPRYPAAVFDWAASLAPSRHLAWDCATGNGQAAVALAERFEEVVASDASQTQIDAAETAEGVEYRVFAAEEPALDDASVDLITVAQALHWFDHGRFFDGVRRVLAPGGAFVAWCYELFRVDPVFDTIIDAWYRGPLDAYWPAGRRHIEAGYRTIPFPLDPIPLPRRPFEMRDDWTLHAVLGYLGTWSAVKRSRDDRGGDALALVRDELARAWGDPDQARPVVWRLSVLAGR